MQSVHIATKVASSNPAHGEVYSIQHYVIKFFCFYAGTLVSFTNKTEILLKMALNTMNSNLLKIRISRVNSNGYFFNLGLS